MEQTAIVLSRENGMALVRVQRDSACGESCADCNICEKKAHEVWVENSLGACEGERVRLELAGRRVVFMAFVAYIAPLLAAAVVCMAISMLFESRAAVDFISLAALALAVFAVTRLRISKNKKYQSRIVERL